MHLNKTKFILSTMMLVASPSVFAVVETCDQSVNFNNANTYKKVSGVINCVLSANPAIKTRAVSLRNGKRHGKTSTPTSLY